jgi:5-formyltetrahydrofolate cyclo-ligase
MHIKEQKKELRKRIKELKKAVSAGELKRQSGIIQEKIINSEYFKNSEHILLYWALPDEADTKQILQKWFRKKNLYLPVIKGSDLEIVPFEGEDKMIPDIKYGIPEPAGEALEDESLIDVVVVPGMAFDKNNNRLGRGAGYYDRILRRLKHSTKIGLAFDFQFLYSIPVEEHDIRMNMVITV